MAKMKQYEVSLVVKCLMTFEVEAENREDAISEAYASAETASAPMEYTDVEIVRLEAVTKCED